MAPVCEKEMLEKDRKLSGSPVWGGLETRIAGGWGDGSAVENTCSHRQTYVHIKSERVVNFLKEETFPAERARGLL